MKKSKYIYYMTLILLCISCATQPKKTSVEAGDEADEKKDSVKKEEKVKKAEEKKEAKRFDGLKYVGPAKKEFNEGIEKYFSKGCESAIDIWKEALEDDPKNGKIAYNIALCMSRLDSIEESRSWYEKTLELSPDNIEALTNYFLLNEKTDNLDKEQFLNFAENITDEVKKSQFLSWIYMRLKDYDNAIKHAKIVLKADEQNIDAMVTLGTAYFRKDMLELAEMIFSTASQINSDNFRLQRVYGFLKYKMENKKKAMEHFQKAKKLNPEIPEVLNMIAILAMEIEDFETAKNELEFALKIDPDFVECKLNLAIAYKGAKEFEKSRDLLKELEKINLEDKTLLKAIYFNTAILYLDADIEGNKDPKRFDVAREYFTKYLKFVPKRDKKHRKKIAGYMKEAEIEKKKLEAYLKFKKRQEMKRKAAQEEQERFEKAKAEAFDKAIAEDTYESWEKYLKEFPKMNDNDEKGVVATKRFEELKKIKEQKKYEEEKQEAFDAAIKQDTYESWKDYLEKYPQTDEKDEKGLVAKKRFEELKKEQNTDSPASEKTEEKSLEKDSENNESKEKRTNN